MNPRIQLTREQILRLLDGHAVQQATPVGLLEFEPVATPEWVPMCRIPVPPAMTRAQLRASSEAPDELWQNDTYEAMVYKRQVSKDPELYFVHLSIKRYDRAAVRNWRHFQQIKNEIVGPEIEAVELFPRESRLADNANQYHLWCAPDGNDWPIGWENGMVLIRPEEVQAYNDAPHNGRQEPRQDGLTVGDAMDGARPPELDKAVRRFLG